MAMMNPKQLLQLKAMFDAVRRGHPKVMQFLKYAAAHVEEGSIIEITMTQKNGRRVCTNMRVSEKDMAGMRAVQEMAKKGGEG